ncbi:hypothetical protein OIO90_005451 [Microbotryomycetes sp. JL221]|nr:hypothetical protein OIO90_005451 [Microbotryomycetes sp. JL221]
MASSPSYSRASSPTLVRSDLSDALFDSYIQDATAPASRPMDRVDSHGASSTRLDQFGPSPFLITQQQQQQDQASDGTQSLNARPADMVRQLSSQTKRMSFIEASDRDDAIVRKNEDGLALSSTTFTPAWDMAPGGSSNVGNTSANNTSNGMRNKSSASALGSIGDGRPANASPEIVRVATLSPLAELDANVGRSQNSMTANEPYELITSTFPAKARPSSFILGVLPADQARDRKAAANGGPGNMLSVDTSVSPTHSRVPSPVRSAISDQSAFASIDVGNPSRFNAADPSHASSALSTSPTQYSQDRRSSNVLSTLSIRVADLEANMQDLTNAVDFQMRSMRDEISSLRSLVLQSTMSSGLRSDQSSYDRDSAAMSPTIGLGRPPFRAQSHSSIPPSPAPSFSQGDANDKDQQEQIRLLTGQINALSTSVTHLMTRSNSGGSGAAFHLQQQQQLQQQRQVSMPLPSQMSPNQPFSDNWRPERGIKGATPGLGLSAPSSGSGFGPGNNNSSNLNSAKNAMMRSLSASGMSRGNSLNGSSWDPSSSPMVAGGGGSMGSNAPSSNPPGSLGSKWEALGIGSDLFRIVAKYGIGPPTKVQMKAIPIVVRGQDVIAQAPAIQERIQSYVIPSLQSVLTSLAMEHGSMPRTIQIVVITATVDQAAQAYRLYQGLGGPFGISSCLVAGHPSSSDLVSDAANMLKNPLQVLVGTPHKMHELLKLGAVNLADVRLFVVDECDQLLARNLSDHVSSIAKMLPVPTLTPGSPVMSARSAGGVTDVAPPQSRQTAIYSCTVPQDVLTFASSLQSKEPVRVLARRDLAETSAPSTRSVKHYTATVSSSSKAPGAGRLEPAALRESKLNLISDICRNNTFEAAVIICSSVEAVEAVRFKLNTSGIDAYVLHQDLTSAARSALVGRFRSSGSPRSTGPKRALVVYDALSRSLNDVPPVSLVVNFDLPRAVEDYQVRVNLCASNGPAARMGSIIVSLVASLADSDTIRNLESHYRYKITELPTSPTP